MSSLLAFDEAFQRLLARAQPLQGIEVVPTMQADGRVLAEPVISMMDIPAWDTSQMDGYAVRAAELEADPDRVFPISQRIPAGHPGLALRKGTVARIFTGAALPVGADAVVMQENAEEVPLKDGSKGVRFRLRVQPQPGEMVCRKADNVQAGTEILPAGTALTPAAIGLVASVGLPELTVRRRPRVACFFTGDELLMPGQPLSPGAIYNSNRFVLAAALRRLGCEVIDLGIVPDSLEATRASLRQAALDADLIITAGGCRWARKTMCAPPSRPKAKSICGASPSSPASRWPTVASGVHGMPARKATPTSSACPAIRCRRSSPSCCWCVPSFSSCREPAAGNPAASR